MEEEVEEEEMKGKVREKEDIKYVEEKGVEDEEVKEEEKEGVEDEEEVADLQKS